MNMYQRQIALGGMASGGDFRNNPKANAGLAEYRAWHRAYSLQHPGAGREELKAAWRIQKAAMGGNLVGGRRRPARARGSALVGGYSDMTPMKGRALVGGARMSKGIRHCMEEALGPSGRLRCKKYMAGPRSGGLATQMTGGFPGQAQLFKEWQAMNNPARARSKQQECAFYSARQAYQRALGVTDNFRAGAAAAAEALGVQATPAFLAKLRPSRRRASRRAAEPMVAQALEAAQEAQQAEMAAEEALGNLSLEEAAELLG